MIVGRDPAQLDESGVSKAALESLAENTSDGIVAPVLWYALLGLPGIAVYKAINTADSMIGHKIEKYMHFGWAAARLDDLVNLPASRLTGVLFAATAAHAASRRSSRVMRRDAPKHSSPNAGWPEAAMAAALGPALRRPPQLSGRDRSTCPGWAKAAQPSTRAGHQTRLETVLTAMPCCAAFCRMLFVPRSIIL